MNSSEAESARGTAPDDARRATGEQRGHGAPETVIEVAGLTKRFGERVAVDALTMRLRRGEIFGFLGPNGSGKTTSIRMMCGLLTPDAGSGRTLGYDVLTEAAAIKRRVGYMTQRFGLYEDMTLRDNLEFVGRIYGLDRRRARIEETMERFGLGHRQGQLAGQLSGGWKQRLALAACLLHEPRLLLLDEPTAGVDPQARRDFWDEINGLAATGITVLVSTHYMDEAERCHRLGYLSQGRLVACGTPDELVRASRLSSWSVHGADPVALGDELGDAPGVQMLMRLGDALHASGDDAGALEATMRRLREREGVSVARSSPTLEEVFVHLTRQSRDAEAAS